MRALTITVDPSLPKLGWYATYEPAADRCAVELGPLVERDPAPNPRWIVAGFWGGDFEAGDFHRREHLFGSGLRLESDGLHVVPASTTIDRCVYAHDGRRWHLSNSLVVLLGRLGAHLDPRTDHSLWSESPARGVRGYFRQIPVLHPALSTVSQLIYESLRLTPDGVRCFFFRDRPHAFSDYRDYVEQLERELGALWANATAGGRARALRAVTTTSRGYDSTAVTALVTNVIPNVIAWSAPRSNTRIPGVLRGLMQVDVLHDDGSEIARLLGAEPRALAGELAALPAELEAWCWASGQISTELCFHPLLQDAADQSGPTACFAGHAGDAIWGAEALPQAPVFDLERSAPSGAALIEARLASGVVDCSVPYLFGRSLPSIAAITRSAEMKPWQLDNDYDRPIPRRLLEERGIPRGWFGFGKKAVVEDFESPVGEQLRAIFFARTRWSEREESLYRGVNLGLFYSRRMMHFVRLQGDRAKLLALNRRNDKRTLASVRDLHRETFLLCTGLLAERFARQAAPEAAAAAVAPEAPAVAASA